VSVDGGTVEPGATQVAPGLARRGPAERARAWRIVGVLSVTETVSWGILYYAFAAFLVPMRDDLGVTAAELSGGFSLALLVSAAAGVLVGRHLDRSGPRRLMTAGSAAGSALVVAWSQVDSLVAFYAVWAAIGAVMAAVLYEPAFTVLAKHFGRPDERRRAMTAMTLVAALASFIFLPLSQALIDAYGWRDALIGLAVVLAAITVPLHAMMLPPGGGAGRQPARPHQRSLHAGAALRSSSFWLLCTAFFLASFAAVAMAVHAIPFLLERGHSPGFAAFAVGLVGVSQIPGRLLFAPIAARWPRPQATAALFVLMAVGIAAVVGLRADWGVVTGLVLLGMGNGMATLARATVIADAYGVAAYGTISSAVAALTTTARATGPIAAAVFAATAGYGVLLWTLAALGALAAVLAFRAEALAAARPLRPVFE
jgi:MFS family permease